MRARPTIPASAYVVASTVGFAFKGIFARLAYAEGLTVPGVLLLRVLFATPLFLAGAFVLAGRPRIAERRADLGRAVLAGALFFFATLSDFMAIAHLGAGISRVILFVYPLFLVLLEAARRREAPSPRKLFAFALAWTGMVLVVSPFRSTPVGAPSAALLFGLAAAASYALYLFVSQPLTRRLGSPWFAAASNVGTALALGLAWPLLAPEGPLGVGLTAAGWVFALAITSTVLPFFLLFEGIRRAGAERAGLLSLVGPVVTVAAAFAVLGETLTLVQLAGTAVVIAGVGLVQRGEPEARRDPLTAREPAS